MTFVIDNYASKQDVLPFFEILDQDVEFQAQGAKVQANFNKTANNQLLVGHMCTMSKIDCVPIIEEPIIDRHLRNRIPIQAEK